MKCPRCQAENVAGAHFCEDCGTRLEAACPSCGAPVTPGKKFCRSCGAALTTEPASRFASPEAYTPRHLAEKILTSKAALEGERKQVTVLFADMKGSMELLADRDPEEARKLLDPVLEHMMDAVHRYEGTVNQVMGDGIMALFGAPLAHEDHAVRACYAALRMQDAIGRYSKDLRLSHGIEVQIRAGLNSGEVVVRTIGSDLRMDYTAVGLTTHLAARMEQLAAPGSTRLTADTLSLAEGYVAVKPLGTVPVKGLAEPVEVYELTGPGAARTRLQAAGRRGLSRFVGRDAEMEQLRRALERSGQGHGQVVGVVGEPGVGKSRLFWELTHSHRVQDWLVLESSAASYGKATAYLPVINLLKAYFEVESRDDPRKVREKVVSKVLMLDRALEPTLSALLALLDVGVDDPAWERLDPSQRRRRTLDAVKRLLLRESQVQPLLLVIEDLHWSDTETQALLDGLVDSLPTARLLLLVSYRPEYRHAWESKTYYSQLRVDPLAPESADELLRSLLGDDAAPDSLKQLLVRRTEGNPFFLEESVQTLIETRVLTGERGAYRLAADLRTVKLPPTVQAVLAARIDRLPREEKRLLQSAAVIGKDVPFALLHAIAELAAEELRHSLASLLAAEFLYETRFFPDLEYVFKHALIQEAAYTSLLKDRRQHYHQKIAQALEKQFPETVETQPEVLAHHYTEAGFNEPAVAYWQKAGQRAIGRSAHEEAINHLRRGLEVLKTLADTPARTQQELELQMTLGPALVASKGYAAREVEHAYRRALALCQQVGETPRHFPALWGLWNVHLVRAQLQPARDLAEQLLQLAQPVQDPALLLEAHDAMGQTLCYLGELAATRMHMEHGLALYDPQQHHALAALYGEEDPGVACYLYLAWVLWLLGYPDQSLAYIHNGLTLAENLRHPHSEAFARFFAAVLHKWRREGQALHTHAAALELVAGEHGLAYWLGGGMLFQGWAVAEQGNAYEGIAQMHRGIAVTMKTGAEGVRPFYLAPLAEAHGTLGQVQEGLSVLVEALALVDKTGERFWEAELYRLKGELLKASSDESQAETCFHRALEVSRHQQAKSWELRAAMSLSRLWQQQGKRAEARQMLAEVYTWFSEGFDTADLGEAKALLEDLSL